MKSNETTNQLAYNYKHFGEALTSPYGMPSNCQCPVQVNKILKVPYHLAQIEEVKPVLAFLILFHNEA